MRRLFIEEYGPMHGISPAEAAKEFDSSYEWGMAHLLDGIMQMREQSGIICLSAIPNSIRMWSYYA